MTKRVEKCKKQRKLRSWVSKRGGRKREESRQERKAVFRERARLRVFHRLKKKRSNLTHLPLVITLLSKYLIK